jgi:tripartite-type tricarboxylate transporter receptor subunit TctC
MKRHLVMLASLLCAMQVFAQQQPKTIRVIFPYPPGSMLDGLARTLGQQMAEAMGMPVVVDNRAGANTFIGMNACAKAPPDGSTVCMTVAESVTHNPFLFTSLPYDPENDFIPVTNLAWIQSAVVASSLAPFTTFKEMVSYAKANPGKVTWGTAGSASIAALRMNWIMLRTGTQMTAIPFKGVIQAWAPVLAGEVHVTSVGLGFAMPQIKAGKVRLIAVDGLAGRRLAAMPDVPSLAEEGIDLNLYAWFGTFAPAKTPKPVVDHLHAEIVKALRTPKVQEFMRVQTLDPVGNSPAEFADFLKKARVEAAHVFKTLGIKPESP